MKNPFRFVSFLFWVFIALLIALPFANAQEVSPSIKNSYPSGVVLQVMDIVSKTGLSAEKQVIVANLILAKENAVDTMLSSGKSSSQIILVKNTFDDRINEVLGVEERYDQYVKTTHEKAKHKYTYSQFAIAMRYKDSLSLSPVQESALLQKIDTLKQMKNAHYAQVKKSLDTRAYESAAIAQILTNAQYDKVLLYKNEDKAKAFASSDWKELQQRGLDSTYTEVQVVRDLTNYYLARESMYNKYQHDLVRQKSEARDIYYHRPTVLRVLERARRNPANNTQNRSYPWGN